MQFPKHDQSSKAYSTCLNSVQLAQGRCDVKHMSFILEVFAFILPKLIFLICF